MTLTFYSDPGHAWLKAPRELVERLKVPVSTYSYIREGYLYLEEDCDAPALLEALEAHGIEVKIVESVAVKRYSKIRNYQRFVPG